VNADAQLNRDVTATPRHREPFHCRPDIDRHIGYLGHVTVAITLRHTADDDVDAADGFDLQQQQQQQQQLASVAASSIIADDWHGRTGPLSKVRTNPTFNS